MARRAVPADLDRLTRTASRAFARDPLMRWILPDDAAYEADHGRRIQRLILRLWSELGEVWTTEDGVALAAWGAPEMPAMPEALGAELGALRAGFPDDVHARLAVLGPSLREQRPAEPHWYLNILATHPDWQRQGLGLAVMADVRRRCDEQGIGQYLETATDDDVAYYRARGFEVTTTWTMTDPADAAHRVEVTGMWRPPGAGVSPVEAALRADGSPRAHG